MFVDFEYRKCWARFSWLNEDFDETTERFHLQESELKALEKKMAGKMDWPVARASLCNLPLPREVLPLKRGELPDVAKVICAFRTIKNGILNGDTSMFPTMYVCGEFVDDKEVALSRPSATKPPFLYIGKPHHLKKEFMLFELGDDGGLKLVTSKKRKNSPAGLKLKTREMAEIRKSEAIYC